MENENKIIRLAYLSRTFLITFQYFANLAIPDHDAKVFLYPAPQNKTEYDKIVDHFLGGFLRWDSQYFMHISKYGYTYENTLAFFPLYPLTVGFISDFLADIIGKVYLDSILLVTFISVNVYFFRHSAIILYKLTEYLFNKNIAYNSAVLFCFNPASIFFIAPYTECIFSYLTFLSIFNCLQLYDQYSKSDRIFKLQDLLLLLPIALSTVTRSNGILNIGFLMYTLICLYKKNVVSTVKSNWNCIYTMLRYGLAMLVTVVDCLLPFIAYQYYCFHRFCHNSSVALPKEVLQHASKNNFMLPGNYDRYKQKWCNDLVPLAYSYVQDHYWDVGFLRYYHYKQLPNFLLALPILAIILCYCSKYFCINFISRKVYRIFLMENPGKISRNDLYQPRLLVFYVHALFLALFCTFFIHIQVSTRLICSASPVFYWICSKQLNLLKMPSKSDSLSELFLRTYFVSFFIVGCLLFCNFFPWT